MLIGYGDSSLSILIVDGDSSISILIGDGDSSQSILIVDGDSMSMLFHWITLFRIQTLFAPSLE